MRRLIRWLALAALFPQSAMLYHNLAQDRTTINLPGLGGLSLNSLGILLAIFIALEVWRSLRRVLGCLILAAVLLVLGGLIYWLR